MNNNCIAVLMVFSVLIGCSDAPGLSLGAAGFTEADLELCQQRECPTITADYIVVTNPTEVARHINAHIENYVAAAFLAANEAASSVPETPKVAAATFARDYFRDKEEFPEMSGTYEATVHVRDSYLSEGMLSVEMSQYTFTGGAHGYGSTVFANFDTESGEKLSADHLFLDTARLLAIAEQAFRDKYGIPSDSSINATGFWFENERFHLPESIGFSEKGAILHYNPYDIASYAEGAIEIVVPWKEITPVLATQYR